MKLALRLALTGAIAVTLVTLASSLVFVVFVFPLVAR